MSTKTICIWLAVGVGVGLALIKFAYTTVSGLPLVGTLYTNVYNSGAGSSSSGTGQ